MTLALIAIACRTERAVARSSATPTEQLAAKAAPSQGNHQSGGDRSVASPLEAKKSEHAPAARPGAYRLLPLAVPGFLDAIVALPEGEVSLPVLVSTHGAGGDPERTCSAWAERVNRRAIVLCPRGRTISSREPYGYYYPDHFSLQREVVAALEALNLDFGNRIVPGPMLYAGYSQGATMGALFLPAHAARFPFLVLTEGGFSNWTMASARKFKTAGGRRVLFVCGGGGCTASAKKSAALLDAAGVLTRVEHVPDGGHTDEGLVGERLDSTYHWVLQDAP